jgi:glycine cleavage system aminomethyltransferase T
VKLDKAGFIGRTALLKAQHEPLRKKLVTVLLSTPEPYAWGGEPLLIDGQPVGELCSAGWSLKASACVGFGYLRGDAAQRPHAGTPIEVDLWGQAVAATAWDRWPAV